MNWTKTPPTKPGAYWWRMDSQTQFPRLILRWASGQIFGDIPSPLQWNGEMPRPVFATEIGGEWCGPLVPVEEVEKAHEEGWKYALSHGPHSKFDAWKESRARKIVEGEL